MDKLNFQYVVDCLSKYKQQIGAYDLSSWEVDVEKFEAYSLRRTKSSSLSEHTKVSEKINFNSDVEKHKSVKTFCKEFNPKMPKDRDKSQKHIYSKQTSSTKSTDSVFRTTTFENANTDIKIENKNMENLKNNDYEFQKLIFSEKEQDEDLDNPKNKPNPNLIDVDLVKGNMFSKAKVKLSNVAIVKKSILYYIFMPMYHQWWRHQFGEFGFKVVLFLYIGQIFNWWVYLYSDKICEEGEKFIASSIELLYTFTICLFILIIHFRVVATKVEISETTDLNIFANSSILTQFLPIYNKILKLLDTKLNLLTKFNSINAKNLQTKKFSTTQTKSKRSRKASRKTQSSSDRSTPSTTFDTSYDERIENSNTDTSDTDLEQSISQANLLSDFNIKEPKIKQNKNYHKDPLESVHKSVPSYTANNQKVGTKVWMNKNEKVYRRRSNTSMHNLPQFCVKKQLSAFEIATIFKRNIETTYASYFNSKSWVISIFGYSIFLALVPIYFRLVSNTLPGNFEILDFSFHNYYPIIYLMNLFIVRLLIWSTYFSMLIVALQAYYERLLFAKMFDRITSARKAKRTDIPHFRLSKSKNIKIWLTLRSYLKRRGPQRSIDILVSSCFIIACCLLFPICIILLKDHSSSKNTFTFWKNGEFLDSMREHRSNQFYLSIIWESAALCFLVSIFLLKYIIIGSEINKKYLSTSVLLTEQINIFFKIETNSDQKESLMRANSILQLVIKLLSEIESPYKVAGVAMSPLLFQTIRLLVLSAFSGVLSEVVGFNMRLWKIKS